MHNISDVATDPASRVTTQGRTTIIEGAREGVNIRENRDRKPGRTRVSLLQLRHDLADLGALYQAIEDDHEGFLILVGNRDRDGRDRP
jgi:hypothetical protein